MLRLRLLSSLNIRSLNAHSLTLIVSPIIFFIFGTYWLFSGRSIRPVGYSAPLNNEDFLRGGHPIDHLIANAHAEWQSVLAKETKTANAAAEQYRRCRGRHPPPGFVEWFEFAQSRKAVIVEDFFDQIYHDLNPFWGLEPTEIRRRAQSFEPRIVVRSHKATPANESYGVALWMDPWLDLVKTVEQYLPDLDMPFNPMDESRMVAPWETIRKYVGKEISSRRDMMDLNPADIISEFTPLSDPDEFDQFVPHFLGTGDGPFWNMARVGCPTDSPSRNSQIVDSKLALPLAMDNFIQYSRNGYVQNWTQSKDVCSRPEIQALHGTFIEPVSVSTTHDLFPLFGGSKLTVNNEILIPPAMYWAKDERYSGGEERGGEWESKKDVFMWRGMASGGRNRPENWIGFQRHRLLAMMNATSVAAAEKDHFRFQNFILPSYDYYNLTSGHDGRLPDLLDMHVDVGFVHLMCYPCDAQHPHCTYDLGDPRCFYTEPYFALTHAMPMKDQYGSKYLPDVDGNSFSGRYRGFLLSTSLPIKSTIYNEWHDSRLIPWAHFVPMDTAYFDIYGIMEYFLGYDTSGHDDAARKIALDGKAWAEKVLRPEDMQIYIYRLLLEYARVCDDRRDVLGYIDDVLWQFMSA